MLYMKYVYVLGGGRGSSGLCQEIFEMNGTNRANLFKFGLSIRENAFAFTFKVVFTYALCLCQSDSASVLWYFTFKPGILPVKPVNHTSWVALVTPTDRPKSVRNRCLIDFFGGVVCVVTLPF